MTPTLPAWLAQVKATHEKASKGPLYLYASPKVPTADMPEPYYGVAAGDPTIDPDFPVVAFCGGGPNSANNAAAIHAALIALPALVKIVEAALAENKAKDRQIHAILKNPPDRVECDRAWSAVQKKKEALAVAIKEATDGH